MRESTRARHVRLVMTIERGLEVVVPRGFDRRKIPEILADKEKWIARAVARIEAHHWRLEIDPPRLPGRIALQALGEEWRVEYRPRPSSHLRPFLSSGASEAAGARGAVVREHPARRLVLTGDLDDRAACREALCRWLNRKARQKLVPRLEGLAREHGFKPRRVSVRQQRTRWASCSRHGAISLNARLLFLPPAVVDYVLLHELCHTVEMNHSPRFWTLLGYHDPQCRNHRRMLRTAGATLPTWLEHESGALLLDEGA